ncbi:MAG: 50S ribosomal protein L21 [bacterium]|nr:50S ribosomal protein L21 [bacterium]
MYAIVEKGGKQYRVEKGARVRVDRIDCPIGEEVELDHVLLVADKNKTYIGEKVDSARVTAEVVEQSKDKKIIVFKFKKRKNYRVKRGHRQPYTWLLIREIQPNLTAH